MLQGPKQHGKNSGSQRLGVEGLENVLQRQARTKYHLIAYYKSIMQHNVEMDKETGRTNPNGTNQHVSNELHKIKDQFPRL